MQDCFGSIQVAMKDIEEGEGVGESKVERVVVVVRKKEWEVMFERKEGGWKEGKGSLSWAREAPQGIHASLRLHSG